MSIKKLVFSGGGIKGIAYIGILKYLEEKDLVKNVNTIVGTSVGALFALLITLGYKSDQIYKLVEKIDFKKLQNINTDSILNVFDNYGIDNFDNIINLINIIIETKMPSKDITFGDLFVKTNIKLVISVTCLNTKKLVFFDHINYPNVQINKVIKMAMCIPILFTPVKFNNFFYVDGGIINNFSIDLFDENDTDILGFVFKRNNYNEINSFETYLKSIIFTPINEKESDIIEKYKHRCVLIDCGNYSLFDLDINQDDKKNLYNIGYKDITNYFIKNKWEKLKNKISVLNYISNLRKNL